jgi:hypothetical protein
MAVDASVRSLKPAEKGLRAPLFRSGSTALGKHVSRLFIKDLIGAIQTITAAAVDETNTLPPGNPAVVDLSVTDGTLHFTFDIPQGVNGVDGVNGSNTAPMAATALLVSKAPKSSRGCVRAR